MQCIVLMVTNMGFLTCETTHFDSCGLQLIQSDWFRKLGEPLSGRLEIFINNQWGTVCDNLFDTSDAMVACKQLGFPGGVSAYGSAGNLG